LEDRLIKLENDIKELKSLIESFLKVRVISSKKSLPVNPDIPDLVSLWNESGGLEMTKAFSMGKRRSRLWARLWNEIPDLSYWIDLIKWMSEQSLYRGEVFPDFRGDIGFLLKEDKHIELRDKMEAHNAALVPGKIIRPIQQEGSSDSPPSLPLGKPAESGQVPGESRKGYNIQRW